MLASWCGRVPFPVACRPESGSGVASHRGAWRPRVGNAVGRRPARHTAALASGQREQQKQQQQQQQQGGAPGAPSEARQRLLALLDTRTLGASTPGGAGGAGLYHAPAAAAEVAAAVEALIADNPSLTPGLDTPSVGAGTWEVFYAPHIARMSSALGARFEPIRYTLGPGGAFSSNVRFASPLLGTGWLSAAGTLAAQDEGAVRVDFKDFWIDRGNALRTAPPARGDAGAAGLPAWADPLVTALGRAAFLPQLSVFPVLYLDAGATPASCQLAVFKFPPLDSNIAVRRVAPG